MNVKEVKEAVQEGNKEAFKTLHECLNIYEAFTQKHDTPGTFSFLEDRDKVKMEKTITIEIKTGINKTMDDLDLNEAPNVSKYVEVFGLLPTIKTLHADLRTANKRAHTAESENKIWRKRWDNLQEELEKNKHFEDKEAQSPQG